MSQPVFIFDTSIVLHLVRSLTCGRAITAQFGFDKNFSNSLICIVSVGEIESLSLKRKWGQSKTRKLDAVLNDLTRINIDPPELLNAYAQIDVFSERNGRTMGKNGLWIAAAARVTQSTLLTTDADFDHLDGIWLNRIRLDAKSGAIIP